MMKVITANTFKTGEVVFLGPNGWVSALEDAVLFEHEENLEDVMARYNQPDHVVGIYAIDVEVSAEAIKPHHIREKIRAKGPGNYQHHRRGDTSPLRH